MFVFPVVFSMSHFHLTSAREMSSSPSFNVSMEVLVTCLTDCPPAPGDGSQVHYTFDVKVGELGASPIENHSSAVAAFVRCEKPLYISLEFEPHDRLPAYPMLAVFYFSWLRHQIDWTDGFRCLFRKTLAKRGKRKCQRSEAMPVGFEPRTSQSSVLCTNH